MTRAPVILAVLAGLAASASSDAVILTKPVIDALTQVDTLASSDQLTQVHGGAQEALDNLRAIALSDTVDRGVQIRAVRALAEYCAPPCSDTHDAHVTLETLLATPRYRDARSGSDLLVLRAGIESIGILRIADDIDVLLPHLNHPSRDIRAAAAHALRDLGNPSAIVPLRDRFGVEQVPQVELAISDALRVLGQPIP